MERMLDEIAQTFPEDFFEELNGGIMLLPEAKLHEKSVGSDLFILGEYHHDMMGRYIAIYYGSFMNVYGHLERAELFAELKKTLSHEFTHHWESLGGERGLEIKDEERLDSYLGQFESDEEE